MELDNTDREILKILSRNARTPNKAIAEEVFVSAPTVSARIDAMTKAGIIKGYHADVNVDAVGNFITAYINMEAAPSVREELYDKLRSSREVTECSRVTGEYSLLIKAVFPSTESLDKFTGTLQHYGKTNTQIVFSTVIHRPFI